MNTKFVIDVNKYACKQISELEESINDSEVKTEKDKANFGNLCIALKGFRMVAESTEAMLFNEDIVKTEDGDFYEKVKETIVPPTTKDVKGNDYEKDSASNN